VSLVALPGRQQCHQSHCRLRTERIAVIGHNAAYAAIIAFIGHSAALLSAAAGDIATGIGGGGEECLLGQAAA
jgi:hypothetical protein